MTVEPGSSDGLEGLPPDSGDLGISPGVDSEAPAQPAISDLAISERYRVIKTLAPGPADALYLARRLDTGALAELRVLSGDLASDEDLVAAFREQAALLDRLSGHCPAIAKIHECERAASGALVLATGRPEGPTLRETISLEGALNLERALHVAIEIAEPFCESGLIHGALRPENVVLVGAGPTVVLTQFGVDWLLVSRSPAARVSDAQVPKDSVYQAPEQAAGQATQRSDVYALGVILYEMLTGTPPPPGMAFRRYAEPGPLRKLRPEVTKSLERVVMRALEIDPERRPMDISAMRDDLRAEMSSDERAPDGGLSAGAGRSKRLLMWGGLAVMGAIALWIAYMQLTPHTSTVPTRGTRPAAVELPSATAAPAKEAAAPGPDTAAGGVSLPEPTAKSAAPVEGPPQLPDREKRQAGPLTPTAVTPAKPTAPKTTASERGERVRFPLRVPDVPAQRPKAPESGDDPGAIIDWLIKEGPRQRP